MRLVLTVGIGGNIARGNAGQGPVGFESQINNRYFYIISIISTVIRAYLKIFVVYLKRNFKQHSVFSFVKSGIPIWHL